MKKAFRVVGCFIDAVISVVIYIFITNALCMAEPTSIVAGSAKRFEISTWASLVLMFLVLFSCMRFSVLYDKDMRARFFSDGDGLYSVREHIVYLFSYLRTYIGLGISAIIYFSFDIEFFALPVFKLFVGTEPTIIVKLALFPLCLLVVFLLYYLASRSACRYWYEDKRRSRYQTIRYTLIGKFVKMITLFVSYFFGGGMFIYLTYRISAVIFDNYGLLISRKTLGTIIVLVVLFVVIPFVWKHLGAIIKRRRFIAQLIDVCDEYHCSLSPVRRPYASLFKLKEGYDFDFERNGKIYACKMLYSKHKLRPMTFFDGGMGAHEKIITVKKTEIFRIRTWFEYSFEADAKKILIINPIPKKLMINDHGKVAHIDNGDSVDGYKIYSATALVNAISRNTLER